MQGTNRLRLDPHHKYWWKKIITRLVLEKLSALDTKRRPQPPRDYAHDCNVNLFLAITPMASQITTPWIFTNSLRTKELLDAHERAWGLLDSVMQALVDSQGVFTPPIQEAMQGLYRAFSLYCKTYRLTVVPLLAVSVFLWGV